MTIRCCLVTWCRLELSTGVKYTLIGLFLRLRGWLSKEIPRQETSDAEGVSCNEYRDRSRVWVRLGRSPRLQPGRHGTRVVAADSGVQRCAIHTPGMWPTSANGPNRCLRGLPSFGGCKPGWALEPAYCANQSKIPENLWPMTSRFAPITCVLG